MSALLCALLVSVCVSLLILAYGICYRIDRRRDNET